MQMLKVEFIALLLFSSSADITNSLFHCISLNVASNNNEADKHRFRKWATLGTSLSLLPGHTASLCIPAAILIYNPATRANINSRRLLQAIGIMDI